MLNRSVPPALQTITSIDLPPVEVISLPNGCRLHCLFNNQQPIIKLEIVLKAGKWYETEKGVSHFTSKMLLEGTKNLSAKQIADIIASFGASLEVNQGYDRTSIMLYCLSKHIDNLLPLVKEILLEPTFPEKELQLLKTRTLQNISIEREKTSYVATQELTKLIYGNDHPYTVGLEEDQINQITREALTTFFKSFYTLKNTEVFISGDFNKITIGHIQEVFNQKNSPLLNISSIIIKKNETIKSSLIIKSEKLQSSIRIGKTLPLMNHPDYPGLALLNKLLGGYFGSRLMKNIREDKGFTYGISSVISPKENDTLFYIGTDIKVENTTETLFEIRKEINILRTELVDEEELETVKNYTIGKFLNDTSNIFDQSERYKTIITHQLPSNFYTIYITELRNTTSKILMDLTNTYFKEEDMYEVVVGNRK